MLEKWKKAIDKGKAFEALLTDLSKAIDCLSHKLITVKLNAFGFSVNSLKLINNYHSHRNQRTKTKHLVEKYFSECLKVL